MRAPVESLVQRLKAKRSGNGWLAQCPAHEDRTPSLSIAEGSDGRALIKCFAGCKTEDVLTALNMKPKELFPAPIPAPAPVPVKSAATEAPKPVVIPRPLGEILDSVVGTLRRFVVFQHPEQAIVAALWVAHTWVIEAFDFTPYLHVFSAEKRSGKSRLLDVLELLVKAPWRGGGETEAVLFRRIKRDQPTFLADEIDTVFHSGAEKNDGMQSLRRMFNLGFTRGYVVSRCGDKSTNFEIDEFDPFCAKVLCGIGRCLPDTVTDRALPIELVRQSREEKVERFRKRDAAAETSGIKGELEAWSQLAGKIDTLRASRPQIPSAIQDRQEEITEPLLAIADEAGGKWPEIARAAVVRLCAHEEDASLGVNLLTDIKATFEDKDTDRLPTIELLNALVAIEGDKPWATWWLDDLHFNKAQKPASRLAKLLKPYGIQVSKIRIDDEHTCQGYLRADFEEAWMRNLPSVSGTSGTSGTSQVKTVPATEIVPAYSGTESISGTQNTQHVPAVPAVPAFREPKEAIEQGEKFTDSGEQAERDLWSRAQAAYEAQGLASWGSPFHDMSDEEWAEYDAWFKAAKRIEPGDWIRLTPDETQPHWQAALKQALDKPCEVCGEPMGNEKHIWYHRTRHVGRCPNCQEADWFADGHEIDEFGYPYCWNHEHTRDERIAERERNRIQKWSHWHAELEGVPYEVAYREHLSRVTPEIQQWIEQLCEKERLAPALAGT